MDLIEVKKINSTVKYYLTKEGTILNRNFDKLKGGTINGITYLNYVEMDTKKRVRISVPRLMWLELKGELSDSEVILLKNKKGDYHINNLIKLNRKDLPEYQGIGGTVHSMQKSFYRDFSKSEITKLKNLIKSNKKTLKQIGQIYNVSAMAIHRAKITLFKNKK